MAVKAPGVCLMANGKSDGIVDPPGGGSGKIDESFITVDMEIRRVWDVVVKLMA